jgi:hypothetical protein
VFIVEFPSKARFCAAQVRPIAQTLEILGKRGTRMRRWIDPLRRVREACEADDMSKGGTALQGRREGKRGKLRRRGQ